MFSISHSCAISCATRNPCSAAWSSITRPNRRGASSPYRRSYCARDQCAAVAEWLTSRIIALISAGVAGRMGMATGLGSWVLGLGSWVLGLGLGSWVLGLGSWVLGLGSWVSVLSSQFSETLRGPALRDHKSLR